MQKGILVSLIVFVIVFAACNSKPKKTDPAVRITERLTGTWQEVGGLESVLEFTADGKIVTINGEEAGTWKIESPNVLVRKTWDIATQEKVHFTSINDVELTRVETKDADGNVIEGEETVSSYRRIEK